MRRTVHSLLAGRDVEVQVLGHTVTADWLRAREARFGRAIAPSGASPPPDREALHESLKKAFDDYEGAVAAEAARRERFEGETIHQIRAEARQDAEGRVRDQLQDLRDSLSSTRKEADTLAELERQARAEIEANREKYEAALGASNAKYTATAEALSAAESRVAEQAARARAEAPAETRVEARVKEPSAPKPEPKWNFNFQRQVGSGHIAQITATADSGEIRTFNVQRGRDGRVSGLSEA